MYLMQVYMQMECTDVDYCDFICYLADSPTSEPQYTLERVERKEDFLTELLSRKYLPQADKGTISRLDLYRAWYRHIQSQYEHEDTRSLYTDPIIKNEYDTVTTDEDLNQLSKVQARIEDIKSRVSDELDSLKELSEMSDALKKTIGAKYTASVSNGLTLVKITKKTPPIDFKLAFEFLGGEEAMLEKDEQLENFRRTTGSTQISITHGEH
jgi:hypothetical protein